MISEERQGELMADFEYNINRHLDKQWIIAETINYLTEDKEERQFLHSTNHYFAVLLPNKDEQ